MIEDDQQEEAAALTTIFVDDRATARRLKRTRLVVIDGPDRGKELLIERERATVGRSVICDLELTDKAVSGTHVEIVASEGGHLLRDLDSTNGTFLADHRVRELYLKPGSVVRLGQTAFRFETLDGTVEIDLSREDRFFDLVGKSLRMREIFATLEKVAPTDLTVLIRGETGTGKELVARALHAGSRRTDKPFVVQDCSAIPKELVESTLFGHEKGSFTGATERHRGCFEQADGGTVFLDEIGELDLAQQPKLLRVLENREVKRVGGTQTVPVNVRVVAATNRDLRAMVNEGSFREDLYYRLGVVHIELPALRERREDIPILVRSFLDDAAKRKWPGERRQFTVEREAMSRLQGYGWPGNVRELRNATERAAGLADSDALNTKDFLPGLQKAQMDTGFGSGRPEAFVDEGLPFKEAKQRVLDEFEAAYLKALLDKYGGNITRSAQAAGLTRYHLRELAKRYGIRGTIE